MSSDPKPVDAEQYTEDYFLERVGGAEFFRLYGPDVMKPALAYAFKEAGLRKGMTALDVGCGRGELLFHLKKEGVEAIGADVAPAALSIAARTAKAPVVRCDAKKLPFADGSFDRIFFLGVLDHLHDWELEKTFSEFARVLKPEGVVLADTCTNTDYYKNLTFEARRSWARRLGLKEPMAPRSEEDENLHVNEHNGRRLREFFEKIGWRGEITPKPNEKYLLRELYGDHLPDRFPMKRPSAWKSLYHGCVFRGPWKKHLARAWFCRLSPKGGNSVS